MQESEKKKTLHNRVFPSLNVNQSSNNYSARCVNNAGKMYISCNNF